MRRKFSSSPDPEAKRKKRVVTYVQKPKKNTKSRVPDPDFLYQLRDEPEEDDLFFTHRQTPIKEQRRPRKRTSRLILF